MNFVATVRSPLASTVRRLEAIHPCLALEFDRPFRAGWLSWRALDAGLVARWIDRVAAGDELGPRPRATAGAFLGSWLAGPLVRSATAALVLERRAPDVSPANVLVRPNGGGWLDGVALRSPRLALVPGDEAAGDRAAEVVRDEPALDDWLADRLVASLAPALEAVRQAAPFGLPGLWGGVGDAVCWTGALVGSATGPLETSLDAWRRAERLVDALAARAPSLRTRSKAMVLEGPSGAVLVAIRGTCCLDYRTPAADLRAQRGESRYCLGCPLRDPDEQRAAWLRELHGSGSTPAFARTSRPQADSRQHGVGPSYGNLPRAR